MSSLSKLQVTSNSLLNWVFQDKDGTIKGKPSFVLDMFSNHLEAVYEKLPETKHKSKISLLRFDKKDYEKKELRFILEISEEISKSKIFSSFLIHGSCADLCLVPGWSDFDAIGILKTSSLSRENRTQTFETCQKIDKMMRCLDPYQHHGIHFIHEKEMNSFPNLYLPVNLLKGAKCLLGNPSIELAKVDSLEREMLRFRGIVKTLKNASDSGILKHHAKDGKYLLENYKDLEAMYQLKYFLCVIMLLPVLWFNLKGDYCRKEDSYEMIRKYFSPSQLEVLEKASQVRASWKSKYFKGNTIPSEVRNMLGMDYLVRGAKFAKMLEVNLDA